MFKLTLATNATNPVLGDLSLDGGDLETILPSIADTDAYSHEIAQRIRTRLLMIRGEWYLDQRKGTPYRSRVLGKAGVSLGLDQIREMFFEVVRSVPGVQAVNEIVLDLDRQARTLGVEIEIEANTSQPIRVADLTVPFVVTP